MVRKKCNIYGTKWREKQVICAVYLQYILYGHQEKLLLALEAMFNI